MWRFQSESLYIYANLDVDLSPSHFNTHCMLKVWRLAVSWADAKMMVRAPAASLTPPVGVMIICTELARAISCRVKSTVKLVERKLAVAGLLKTGAIVEEPAKVMAATLAEASAFPPLSWYAMLTV